MAGCPASLLRLHYGGNGFVAIPMVLLPEQDKTSSSSCLSSHKRVQEKLAMTQVGGLDDLASGRLPAGGVLVVVVVLVDLLAWRDI